MAALAEGNSYLFGESCKGYDTQEAMHAIGEISSVTRTCSNLGGDILRNSNRINQIHSISSMKRIDYHQVESSVFEELVLSHARELACSASFANNLAKAKYPLSTASNEADQMLNDLIDNAIELKKLKKQFSDFLSSRQTDLTTAPHICPSNLTELAAMAEGNEYYQSQYNHCSDLIRMRSGIQILENSFPLIQLRGTVKETIEEITTPGSPTLSKEQMAQRLRGAYGQYQQKLTQEKQSLQQKLQTQGVDGFNRGEKRLLFSDVRLNQRLYETRPELEGVICRMDRRFGTGADNLDMTLGIGSFAVGGMLGIAAKGAKVALVARALGKARSLGLLSANSARNLKLLAAAGVLTADALTGFSDVNGSCFNDLELSVQASSTDNQNQCVSSPDLKKRASNKCWLNASLAALGFLGGIGDLKFVSKLEGDKLVHTPSLKPPEFISRASTDLQEAIDEDEVQEITARLASNFQTSELSPEIRQAAMHELAFVRFDEPELNTAYKQALEEHLPESARFLKQLEELQKSSLTGQFSTDLIDEHLEHALAAGQSREQATFQLYHFLKTHPEAHQPQYQKLLAAVAEQRGKQFYLNGELAPPGAKLDGPNGALTRALNKVNFKETFGHELEEEVLAELSKAGLTDNQARQVYLSSLLTARIPIVKQGPLLSSLKYANPEEYYQNLKLMADPNQSQYRAVRGQAQNQINKDLMLDVANKRNRRMGNASFFHEVIELENSPSEIKKFLQQIIDTAKNPPFELNQEQALLAFIDELNATRRLNEGLMMENADKLRAILAQAHALMPQHRQIGFNLIKEPILENIDQSRALAKIENRYEAVETFNDLRIALKAQGHSEEEIHKIWRELTSKLRLPSDRQFVLAMQDRPLSGDVDTLADIPRGLPESVTDSSAYRPLSDSIPASTMRSENIHEIRAIGDGASGAMLVTFTDGSRGVWKAHNHSGATNYKVDAMVYELDQILGMQLVPETIVANFAGELGSIQRFKESDPTLMQYIRPTKDHFVVSGEEPLRTVIQSQIDKQSFFDHLIDNRDRHTGNFLIQTDGKIVSIDNTASLTGMGGLAHYKNFEQRKEEILRFISTDEGKEVLQKLKSLRKDRDFRMNLYRNLGEDDAEDFYDRMDELLALGQ